MNNSYPTEAESIEGLSDSDTEISLGDYPIDTLLIRNENRTVHDVIRRIEKGTFVMDPDFQRDFVWEDKKQSKLIESVLMRIPLPVFYLAEDKKGRMIVVDGLQRLSTFHRYVEDDFRLKLPLQNDLDKKKFSDLPPKLQNRIEDCNLILYVIDAKVPQKALLDIFERVNSGVPLTRQQMRNCLFMGGATKFLKEESKAEIFLKATGGSLRKDSMRDREMINRFCAFELVGIDKYKGDMDDFLAKGLEVMNELPSTKLEALSQRLRKSLKNNYHVFGKHAFRKHADQSEARSIFNASLWDVMSTGLANYSERTIEANAQRLRAAFYDLISQDKFKDSITLGTNQVDKVKYRFTEFTKTLKETLDDL